MAARLCSPSVAHAKRTISSAEFECWKQFLGNIEPRDHTKADEQMARLTAEVRRGWVSPGGASHSQIKPEDFYVKYADVETQKKPQTKEEATARSKAAWDQFLGLGHAAKRGTRAANAKDQARRRVHAKRLARRAVRGKSAPDGE